MSCASIEMNSWETTLKLTYSIATAAISLWIISFTPSECTWLGTVIPDHPAWVLQVRESTDILKAFESSATVRELLDDPVVNVVIPVRSQIEKMQAKRQQAHWAFQWIFPSKVDDLDSFIGSECALVRLASPAGFENSSPDCVSVSGRKKKPSPQFFITRVSGWRGLLVRMGIHCANPGNAFVLDGDWVAINLNGDGRSPAYLHSSAGEREGEGGGKPRCIQSATMDKADGTSAPQGSLSPGTRALVRFTLYPRAMLGDRDVVSPEDVEGGSPDLFALTGLPDSVANALLKPPLLHEMFDLKKLPEIICLEFFTGSDGVIRAKGTIDGFIPPPGEISVSSPGALEPCAEGLLPIDVKACFLLYIENAMRGKKTGNTQGELSVSLGQTKGQRRWLQRFANLYDREVDLDRDLWPAFGHVLQFSIQDPPRDYSYNYGVLRASIPLKGGAGMRDAAAELVRQRWNYLFDGAAPKNIKPPYVRRMKREKNVRFVLVTGQITAPAWTISDHELTLVSDEGPYALMDTAVAGTQETPIPDRMGSVTPSAYYLRMNGPRLAPTVETLATIIFESIEDDLGSKEFLARHPDAPLQINLAKKFSQLLGMFSLEIKPTADGQTASLEMAWTPGTLKEKEENAEGAPPPPPLEP